MQRLWFEVLCGISYPADYHSRGTFHKPSNLIHTDVAQVKIQGSAFIAVGKFPNLIAKELLAVVTLIPLHSFVHSILLKICTTTMRAFHKFSYATHHQEYMAMVVVAQSLQTTTITEQTTIHTALAVASKVAEYNFAKWH